MPSHTVSTKHELPKLVDSFVTGWRGTLSSGSLASTVLAAVAASLFVHFQEQMKYFQVSSKLSSAVSTPIGDALVLFAYLGIIINCSAAITSFLILDKMVETPFTSAKMDFLRKEYAKKIRDEHGSETTEYFGDGVNALFVKHSDWGSWPFYKLYWVVSLFLGILCIFTELLLYLWIVEPSLGIKISVSVASFLSLLPLFIFLGTGVVKMIKIALAVMLVAYSLQLHVPADRRTKGHRQ